MASWTDKSRRILPMLVKRKRHRPNRVVVHVRSFSKPRWQDGDKYGSVASPAFTVGGLDWVLRYHPGGDDSAGHVTAFVELATDGATAWAYVGIRLLDHTTGRPRPRPCELQRSGYVSNDDCLKIECVIDVCFDRLAFLPHHTSTLKLAAGLLGPADVAVHVGSHAPFAAHSWVLDAHAPRFLKKQNLRKRHRQPKPPNEMMRVTIDDIPAAAVEALLQFVYTGTLPVVAGITGAEYMDTLWRLLLAARKYDLPRLQAICGATPMQVWHRHLDRGEDTAGHGGPARVRVFERLKDACVNFVTNPYNYGLVIASKSISSRACKNEPANLICWPA
ncbi:hypothetical protein QOZ80_8AG0616180 [Eleusine coracana subsp. coracana]|nr:hypothetical protein QOZ80_8AG0616180 [Eleusine coracana subsp. coracana]